MEPAAVAALAVAIDHVHAETLNSLVLGLDRFVHDNQELARQSAMYCRAEQWLRAVVTAALRDLRRGDLESAKRRLLQGDMWD